MDYAFAIKNELPKTIWKARKSLIVRRKKPSAKWIEIETEKIKKIYGKLYERFKHIENIIPLLICYDHVGALGNISLSVHPDLKKRWKRMYNLSHELFGAFYNTFNTYNTEKDLTYCSLFPEIENSSIKCNAYDFEPKKGETYLANPPYTEYHIRWTLQNILTKWSESNFIVVVPVWDKTSRKKLGLNEYDDLSEITEMIKKYGRHHKIIKNFPFYNGIDNKNIILKDPVHIFYIWNDKNKFNKTRKNRQKGGGALFEIKYGSNKINGQIIRKEEAVDKPTVIINEKSSFVLLMTDPDAPGGDFLHWLVCNINEGRIETGETIIDYYGPNPPSSHNHLHHYIFELYKQSGLIDCSDYKKGERALFDKEGFISKYGLTLMESVQFIVDPKA
jgi:hypothetical protein